MKTTISTKGTQAADALIHGVKTGLAYATRPSVRNLLVLAVAGLAIATFGAVSVFAQGSGSNDVGGAAVKAFNTIYNQWRIPVSLLGLTAAAITYMSSSQRGKSYALQIIIAVILWAIVPGLFGTLNGWAF